MKRIFNGKVTVKNFIVAMLSALIIFESVGSMSQIALANGDENSEQTAQQTEQASESAAESNEERNENSSSEESEAQAADTAATETPAETGAETPAAEAPAEASADTGVTLTSTDADTETAVAQMLLTENQELPAEEMTTEEMATEEMATETPSEETTETETPVEEPVEPEKPTIDGKVNNDKIRQYNSGVENYNKQVDAYNKAVDKYYESEVARVTRENEEIEKNNQSEQQKVLENEQNNADLRAKYDEEYAQYLSDKATEQRIYDKNKMTVEQYNDAINRLYNNPANKSVEMNENSVEFSVSDTYSVEEAEEKTGNKIKVIIRHYFEDIDKEYSEEFEIDENDIITLNSASAHLENTQEGWAQFYLGTDDDHTMGYWYNNGSILFENAKYVKSGWNAGESFTISYKDGINHINDDPTIEINFNYAWNPLRTYKTYNVPNAPTLVQNEYTPNFKEMLEAPIKKAYLGYLSLMDLITDPDPVIPTPTPDPEPTPDPQPTPDPVVEPAPVVTPATVVTTIADDQTPLAAAPAQEEAQVLGAKRVRAEGAVLGARRGNTGDDTKNTERCMIAVIAMLGIISLMSIKKEKEEA